MANSRSPTTDLRIGTRGSQLARCQAELVAQQLRQLGHAVELVNMTTTGDRQSETSIGGLGEQGVFTKAIQDALLAGRVDLAIHSLKDLPTDPVEGLSLAAVPPREPAADVLVANAADSLDALPHAARVGTGSLRRQAQLRHIRPDLCVESIRGNVDTRLRKLDDGRYDALILAAAGLHRLGLTGRITQVLPADQMLPAVGQGALGLECRADDRATQQAVAPLDDRATHLAVLAERSLLAHLRGGCLAPVGALAEVAGGQVVLSAVVLNLRGTTRLYQRDVAPPDQAAELGRRVADSLLEQGAGELIAEARADS